MPPLLTVIIPTFRRPTLLQRAIDSALDAAPGGDVEVLVMPNGPDDSWQQVATQRAGDPRIKWHYLERGNASAARNAGLEQSTGRYVRFLDDDDMLLPAASRQLVQLQASGAMLSSGPLAITHAQGGHAYPLPLPACDDYLETALLCVGIGLAAGSVYLRSALAGVRWREDVSLHDDYLWSLEVAKQRDWHWIHFSEPVAAYVQHGAERLSRLRRTAASSRQVVDAILAVQTPQSHGNGFHGRPVAAMATALLTHAHSAFPASPILLSGVIRQALALDANAVPRHPLFDRHRWLGRHLLLTEWSMLPLRWLSRSLRHGS